MDDGLVRLVRQVRRFHRTVTQRVGALHDAYLSRGRPLGQARLLWEIGPEGSEVRSLRSRLDLDSGYLSRMLQALQADGLIVIDIDDSDARVRKARLTPAGLAERAEIDRLSDGLATSILRPLHSQQRDRLVAAMTEVERLLIASMVDIAITDPGHRDARFCLRGYHSDLTRRFDGGFEPARSRAATDRQLTPPAGLLLVARLHSDPVGCGGLRLGRDGYAEVKQVWVSPQVRGLGVGRRLLAELEEHATTRGVRTLRLDTNRALMEAIGLYRAAGFREVEAFNDEPYAHHWFEKTLA